MTFLPPAQALTLIENHILPLTRQGVGQGNKIFGAAIVDKATGQPVTIATNQEIHNPLWHGEVQAIKQFHELPTASRPPAKACYFLATHEPCSLCLSAITWAGFDNFTYLFTHQDSQDEFAIPHDLRILKEVFGLGVNQYRAQNYYWNSQSIHQQIAALPSAEQPPLHSQIQRIKQEYAALSGSYQTQKDDHHIPLN